MSLHLIKLSVGAEDAADHADWQRGFHKAHKALYHVTRMMPKRADDILDGGSLYWVIKGETALRQRILGLEPILVDGVPHCRIDLDPELVPVARRRQRPFQGWRYLEPAAAPADVPRGARDLPADLHRALSDLGLL